MQTEQLLTPKQVAEILQVHVGTLEAWRGRGAGPKWIKLGHGSRAPVRYTVDDLAIYMVQATATYK